jgi:hypothetical protein
VFEGVSARKIAQEKSTVLPAGAAAETNKRDRSLALQAALICGVYLLSMLWYNYLCVPVSGTWRYANVLNTYLWVVTAGVDPIIYLTLNPYVLQHVCVHKCVQYVEIARVRQVHQEEANSRIYQEDAKKGNNWIKHTCCFGIFAVTLCFFQ